MGEGESEEASLSIVYEVKDYLISKWMGKEERSCVVVERRELKLQPGVYKYYVHWHDVRSSLYHLHFYILKWICFLV